MEFVKMISEKNKPLLIFENYKYRKFRLLKSTEEEVWYCTNKNCTAKIYILNSALSRRSGVHNHVIDASVIIRQKISNSVKRQAEENISEKPLKLIRKEMEVHSDAVESLSEKDIRYIRNNINHARLKTMPRLPKSTEEVQQVLSQIEVETSKGESFLFINNFEANIVVFSCETNVKFLCDQEILFMDGTFNYCAKFFLQMFTIHTCVNNIYVPVAFCLLKNKLKHTYTTALRLLAQRCREMGHHLNPKTIVIDFEMAIHSSISEVFPNAKLIGCRFHLSQSW